LCEQQKVLLVVAVQFVWRSEREELEKEVTRMSPFHASMLLSPPKLLLDVPFQQLLEQRNFDKIKAVLTSASDKSLLFWLYDTPKVPPATKHLGGEELLALLTRETPLHRLVALQPPLAIVVSLVQRLTSMFQNAPKEMTDIEGRTPLHVSVISRGRSEMVRFLIKNSTAAVVQDAWMRCPLHWACTQPGIVTLKPGPRGLLPFMRSQSKDSSPIEKNDDMVLTVSALIRAFPEATVIRDCNGLTPLDLAIEHQADYRVVALVHSATNRLRQSLKAIKCVSTNDSDETSATDAESFPAGFPGEISLIHSVKEPEFEPQRACSRNSKSIRHRTPPNGGTRFEC
jgi:Ankyrin repeats (3 copies)